MLRAVLDTSVLLRAVDEGNLLCWQALRCLDLRRCCAKHLLASRLTRAQVSASLNYLAGLIVLVELRYLWRPQLTHVADEMVLGTAINGKAGCIVTFNTRHFAAPAAPFGIGVIRPDEALRRVF